MHACARRAKRRHAEAEGLEAAVAMAGYETAGYGGYHSEAPGSIFNTGVRARAGSATGSAESTARAWVVPGHASGGRGGRWSVLMRMQRSAVHAAAHAAAGSASGLNSRRRRFSKDSRMQIESLRSYRRRVHGWPHPGAGAARQNRRRRRQVPVPGLCAPCARAHRGDRAAARCLPELRVAPGVLCTV